MTDLINLPDGDVTFLFSDIQGSTPLWEDMPEAMEHALSLHNSILSEAISSHEGKWYKSVGDEIQAAFSDPAQALLAAIAGQRGLLTAKWGKTGPIRVRMGIHRGDAIAETTDYATTHTLNRVARIMSSAHGGQIVISQEAAQEIENQLPDGIWLQDMGKHRMKGLSHLEHIHQVIAHGLPSEFPRLKTLDISPNNLPVHLNRFIGRKQEIAKIQELLAASRLVTLTGSGGAGKTRLSLEVAETLQDENPDGVWLVELAPHTDPELVPQTVIHSLELVEDAAEPAIKQLIDFLKNRSLLLILDNCEHLIEASAQLANSLLRACPNLRILASSREALGVPGETPYRVPSLTIPETDHLNGLEEFAAVEAIQLFMDRAQTVNLGFALTSENAPTIAHICKRLDGIPLAIELAAARVKVMQVQQIAERLENRFRLLTGGSRTALPRQQTLRALIDWSYSLLTEAERTLFRRLSVFVGGWDLKTAEAVCEGGEIDSFEVLDLLTSLVDKSLVNTEETEIGVRYRRLETIRQYAREKFLETDDVSSLRDAHLAYFMEQAEIAGTEIQGKNQIMWVTRLNANLENINAAVSWGTETDVASGLRLVNALENYLYMSFDARLGHRWFSGLLSNADGDLQPAIHAKALRIAMAYLWSIGDSESKERYFNASLALYNSMQDETGIANLMMHKGWSYVDEGELAKAEKIFLECTESFKRAGDITGQLMSQNQLAGSIYSTSNPRLAKMYAENNLELLKNSGNIHAEKSVLDVLANLSYFTEEYDLALEYLERSNRLTQLLFKSKFASHSYDKARIHYMKGDYEQARSFFMEAIEVADKNGRFREIHWATLWLGKIAVQTGDLEEAYQIIKNSLAFFENLQFMGVVVAIEWLCELAMVLDRPEQAATLLSWTDVQRIKVGDHRPKPEQRIVDQLYLEIETKLSPQAISEAKMLGERMTSEKAIEYALLEIKP